MNVIGIFAVIFGIPLSESALRVLYGDKWNEGNLVLAFQFYCVYEYAMGLNGILDAFVMGTIDNLKIHRRRIMISTFIYIAVSISLAQFGAVGMIISNIVSMVVRIVISLIFIYGNNFKKGNQKKIATTPPFL